MKLKDRLKKKKVPFFDPRSGWPHNPPCWTHHRPGLPLAVSQKKWLKRSLVLKLLSMIAEWEHGAPGQPTHDCGREPLIPRHMTYSPIIPSGSQGTWSKWTKSQNVWMDGNPLRLRMAGKCNSSGLRPMISLKVPARNEAVMRMEGFGMQFTVFKVLQR